MVREAGLEPATSSRSREASGWYSFSELLPLMVDRPPARHPLDEAAQRTGPYFYVKNSHSDKLPTMAISVRLAYSLPLSS